MKKKSRFSVVFILLFLLFSVSVGCAEDFSSDSVTFEKITTFLQKMSIDELLTLQNEIQRVLSDKGYVLYKELDRGAKGDDVITVQERLKELGYYSGSLSGKFDSETQKAFKLFEKNNNLTNDGKASQTDLTLLFSSAAVAKVTSEIEASKTIIPTPKPENVPEGYLPFSEFNYTEYFRYPEKYYGTKIILRGKAVQVMGSRKSGYQIRLATSGNNDIVYINVKQDPGFNILEDDRLTVYAVMKNTYTYIATFLNSVTVPSADADMVILK